MSTNNSDIEQNSNKRQKLNHDDNKNNNTDIDITSLDKKTITQLKEIVLSSFGITIKSGMKKNEIIGKIKSLHKKKQDTLEKQVEFNNINSFNKGVIEFTIKEGIDPLEWSFWKVFRNKFIYKLIMSFMDKQFSIPYNSITSVFKMIESNKISILRDKVSRNQYLTFYQLDGYNNENEPYNKNNEIYKIFSTFKCDNEQNRLFFKHFYKNYSKFIARSNVAIIDIGSNSSDVEKGREQLVNEMIGARCVPALQILVQDYHYIPTESNLQLAITEGSVKFIKFILQQQPKLEKSIVTILNGLENFKSPFTIDLEYYMNILKSVYYLHNEKIIDSGTLYRDIQSKIKIDETIQLKELIMFGKLLLILSTGSNDETISNNEIESFSNSLSKQELKLPLSDPLFQTQHKKEIIKKILDLYYLDESKVKSRFYNLYFGDNDNFQVNDLVCLDGDDQYQYGQSFQFANIPLLKHCLKKDVYNYNFCPMYNRYLEMKIVRDSRYNKFFIFSHCTGENNKEKRMNFINSLLNHLVDDQICGLFAILVGNDDIEMVKHLSSKFTNGFGDTHTFRSISFIKSIEMLEYLFENHNYIFKASEIWKLSNLQLFKHYELLHHHHQLQSNNNNNKNNNIIDVTIHDKPSFYYRSSIISIEILSYILEKGPSSFKINSTLKSIENILITIVNYYPIDDQCKFEIMKSVFLKYQLFENNTTSGVGYFELFVKSFAIPKFTNWLFINHKDYLTSGKIQSPMEKYQDGIAVEAYFITGRYDQLNDVSPFNDLIDRNIGVIDNGLIDIMCNNLSNSTFPFINKQLFSSIIGSFCGDGKLELLKYIQQNHNWVFKPKGKGANDVTPSIFTIKQLKELLMQSLNSFNLEVSEFLFEFINLTKNEYTSNSNSVISKLYFKDKQFK